jgi:hypothetical protein
MIDRNRRIPNAHSLQIPDSQSPTGENEAGPGVQAKIGKAVFDQVSRATKAGEPFTPGLLYTKPGPRERKILMNAEQEALKQFFVTKDNDWRKAARAIRRLHSGFQTK